MPTDPNSKLRIILTGATGMVGEGVLHECLAHPAVEKVLLLNRRPGGFTHLKIVELVHPDLFDITSIVDQLQGYNACFFCLGTSPTGTSRVEYERITYALTVGIAQTLAARNPGMILCQVSAMGADQSEKNRMHWARILGRTEKALSQLPFGAVYSFRPGYLHPTTGLKNTKSYYRFLTPFYPLFRLLMPRYVSTLRDLGVAMIHAAQQGFPKQTLEVPDFIRLANP